MLSYLLENKVLIPLDTYFAKRLLKLNQDADLLLFMSMLFASFRRGEVCFYPLNLDKTLFASHEQANLYIEALLKGAKRLPEYLVEENPEEKQVIQKPICKFKERYYLQKNWTFETKVLQEIKALSLQKPPEICSETTFLQMLALQKDLDKKQRDAIESVLTNSLTLLSGGPGTGKTFTAALMIKIFSSSTEKKLKVLLCAPTGKASFHLMSKIPKDLIGQVSIEAKTLHSLLQISKDRYKPFVKNLYPYDLIIVDEASMIDLKMMSYLLSSISKKTRLVLIGDKNQLSPVETGQVFAEACSLKQTVFLEKTHRFSNPNLLTLTKGICDSNPEEVLFALEQKDPALQFHSLTDSYSQFTPYLDSFIKPQKEPYNINECFLQMKHFQILSAKKQGALGVDGINNWILYELIKNPSTYFAYPIMITSNDYKKKLFNGMMGIVVTKRIYPLGKIGKAYFQGPSNDIVEFSLQELYNWEYAYAISVHKSQGSEFDHVLTIIPDKSESFGRELLYTAATRAKKSLTLLTKKGTLLKMVEKSGLKGSLLEKRMQTATEKS